MAPLDPGREWLAAGITGLARQREWDAVATTNAPGRPGDEVRYVALADGPLVTEDSAGGVDPIVFADALRGRIDPPYRAVAVRRPELWAVGAVSIDAVRLVPSPAADELTLTWDGDVLSLLADDLPAEPSGAAALEELATARHDGPYAAHAHRLAGDVFEVLILPL